MEASLSFGKCVFFIIVQCLVCTGVSVNDTPSLIGSEPPAPWQL